MRENTLVQTMKHLEEDGESQTPVVIEPLKSWLSFDLRELWDYRELLYFFIWRDIKVRYKQTILGGLWVILQPLMPMIVFSLFFGLLVKVPSDNLPYPIFTYTALLPWHLFAYAFYASSGSLVANQSLITKVYFPRLLVPLSILLGGLIDFLIPLPVLVGMMYYYGIELTWTALYVPLFLLLTLLTALAVGLWSSALHVQYRDVHHIINFSTQFLMFATPIFYPASIVPENWRLLYGLNPMVGVVEGFRWALLGEGQPFHPSIFVSVPIVILLLISGLLYFNRVEKTFADHL
ncbi:MAG TPA: ABC transporter permease [Anaerolineales bacterium]|nr:ABC transporter permease [Anaerolineales bacterium]